MMRWCVFCQPAHFLGEVAPLDQKDRTDGLCPAAALRENRKIDEMIAADHLADFEIPSASPTNDSVKRWSPLRSVAPSADLTDGERHRIERMVRRDHPWKGG